MGLVLEEVAPEFAAAHNLKSEEPTETDAFAELAEQGLRRRGEAGAVGRYLAVHLAVYGPVRRRHRHRAILHRGWHVVGLA